MSDVGQCTERWTKTQIQKAKMLFREYSSRGVGGNKAGAHCQALHCRLELFFLLGARQHLKLWAGRWQALSISNVEILGQSEEKLEAKRLQKRPHQHPGNRQDLRMGTEGRLWTDITITAKKQEKESSHRIQSPGSVVQLSRCQWRGSVGVSAWDACGTAGLLIAYIEKSGMSSVER